MTNVLNLEKKFAIKFINRLITDEDAYWKCIPQFLFDRCLPNYSTKIWNFNVRYNDIKGIPALKNISAFYINVLETWFDNKELYYNITKQDILWKNTCIMYRNKTLYMTEWIKKGFILVDHFLDQHHCLLPFNHFKQFIPDTGNLLFQYNAIKVAMSRLQIDNIRLCRGISAHIFVENSLHSFSNNISRFG